MSLIPDLSGETTFVFGEREQILIAKAKEAAHRAGRNFDVQEIRAIFTSARRSATIANMLPEENKG